MRLLVATRKAVLERELREWIESELAHYVRGFISDSDYATLLKNLIDIAKAHAAARGEG